MLLKSYPTLLFIGFHAILSARLVVGGDVELDAWGGGVLAVLYALVAAWSFQRPKYSSRFAGKAKFGFFLFVLTYLVITGYECIYNSPATYNTGNGRWYGLESGPTFLGTHAAIFALVVICGKFPFHERAIILVACSVAIVANGSRGAVLLFAAGILAYLLIDILQRPKHLAHYLGLCVFLLTASLLIPFDSIGNSRLVSIEDTRSGVWSELVEDFQSAPIFGRGDDVHGSENSFLRALAITGMLGFACLAIHLVLYVFQTVFVLSCRRNLPEVKLWLSIAAAILAHSFFDGDLVDRRRLPVLAWWLSLAATNAIVNRNFTNRIPSVRIKAQV